MRDGLDGGVEKGLDGGTGWDADRRADNAGDPWEGAVRALFLALPVAAAVVGLGAALGADWAAAGLILAAGGPLAALAVERPFALLCLFAAAHFATPAYVRMPVPAGLYSPPVSTALLAALIAIGGLRALAGRRMLPVTAAGRRVIFAFGLFACVAATSLFDPRTTAEGGEMWIKVFVFPAAAALAVAALCIGVGALWTLAAWCVAGAVVASMLGVGEQMLGHNPLIDRFAPEIAYHRAEILGATAYRAFSVYGNPLEFATCVGMVFPFALMAAVAAGPGWRRGVWAAAAVICALGVAVTVSRGPMLALLVGVGVIAALHPGVRRLALAATLMLALLVALGAPFAGGGATARVAGAPGGGGVAERVRDMDNVTLRLKLWRIAGVVFADHPLRGVGFGGFANYRLDALRAARIGPFHEFGENSIDVVRVAESSYVQLAAETGILGLAALAGYVLALLALTRRVLARATDPAARTLAIAALGALAVYGVNGAFITAYTHYFSTLFALGIVPGILLSLDRIGTPAPDRGHRGR